MREIFNTAVLTPRAGSGRDMLLTLSGTGQVSPLKLPSESLFAFIKMFARIQKIRISPMMKDGNVNREIELDGDETSFNR